MGGGKVTGQLSRRPVGTLVVRERMRKAPAVQSGHALPMSRCTSYLPPPPPVTYSSIKGSLGHYMLDPNQRAGSGI